MDYSSSIKRVLEILIAKIICAVVVVFGLFICDCNPELCYDYDHNDITEVS